MKRSPLLEFESSVFAVVPGEDTETNPGIYGKALAQWLADQLREAGVRAGAVIAEDFGWCIPVESRPHSLSWYARVLEISRDGGVCLPSLRGAR